MFIKTVSTTSGINPIKFNETGGVFYWILNTGSSTIYASTKSTFTAGDDGVVSLGPKESRRLETNNDTIYILGEGQVEIHNQRDGICSFKQAPTSSGSGGGGTIDAYSKTESDSKYAQKTDIPTSLPANGGNADTVDDYHVSEPINISTTIPPEYFTDVARINPATKKIESWHTDNIKVALAKDANTVGGKSASDFMPYIGYVDDLRAVNQNCICSYDANTLNTPYKSGKTLSSAGICIVNNINGLLPTYFVICTGAKQCFISYQNNGEFVGDWKEISTTPIKSTGLITSPTDEYGTIILPNSDTRRYLSITAVGCYAEMLLFNDKYTVHIANGNYEKIINTPVTYIAFYIE